MCTTNPTVAVDTAVNMREGQTAVGEGSEKNQNHERKNL